ncbi:hypothetical protein MRB53_032035 [Persea americana]|uniref:Uncharacterized protein n=1 Tax=Persea americana TaxID=3435 RepID=A0ACC2KQT8_PERAE|nr:hypothetical protein MRB53_032035 [Persea americana]
MHRTFAANFKTRCPPPTAQSKTDPTVSLDVGTPIRLDSKYYKILKHHKGLLSPDQTLSTSPSMAKLVRKSTKHNLEWTMKTAAIPLMCLLVSKERSGRTAGW